MPENLRARTRVGLAVFLAVVALTTVFSGSWATTFISSFRPLTEDEPLEYSVGNADAILVGMVTSQTDSVALVPSAGGEKAYIRDRHVEIQPIRWLKGGSGLNKTKVGFWPQLANFETQKDWDRFKGQRILLFLRTLRDKPREHPTYSPEDDWSVIEAPHMYGGGALLLGPQSEALEEAKVLTALEKISVDSLVARSDLVATGEPDFNHESFYPVYGIRRPCIHLDIDERIVGNEPRDTIPVYSVMGGIKPMRSVMFLKAMPGGIYEVVAFHAGQDVINGSRVQSGETLEELKAKIRASRAHGGSR